MSRYHQKKVMDLVESYTVMSTARRGMAVKPIEFSRFVCPLCSFQKDVTSASLHDRQLVCNGHMAVFASETSDVQVPGVTQMEDEVRSQVSNPAAG